jgi:hypothetical protein
MRVLGVGLRWRWPDLQEFSNRLAIVARDLIQDAGESRTLANPANLKT